MAFDEIIMCAALHGLARDFHIPRCAHDQYQGIRHGLKYLIERLEALTVGKREIKQDHRDILSSQTFECSVEPRHPFDMKCVFSRGVVSRTRERVLDLSGIGGIVLDEEYRGPWIIYGKSVHCDMPWPSSRLRGKGYKYLSTQGRYEPGQALRQCPGDHGHRCDCHRGNRSGSRDDHHCAYHIVKTPDLTGFRREQSHRNPGYEYEISRMIKRSLLGIAHRAARVYGG